MLSSEFSSRAAKRPPGGRRNAGRGLLSALFLGFFLHFCAHASYAQDNGGSNGHSASQPVPISELIKNLRAQGDASKAAASAATLLSRGEKGRDALLEVLRDRTVPAHVLAGVLEGFLVAGDWGEDLQGVLFKEFAARDEGRHRQVFRHALREYDRQRSMLTSLVRRLEMEDGNGARPELLAAVVGMVDTPRERLEVTGRLIDILGDVEDAELRGAIREALSRLTFQRGLNGRDAWRSWFADFQRRHPDGFQVQDLVDEALRRNGRISRSRWVAAQREAVDLLAASNVLPVIYLDPTREEEVRAHAARRMAAAAGEDPERRQEAVRCLVEVLERPQDTAVPAALESLAELVRVTDPGEELQKRLKKRLIALAGAQDLSIVQRAVAVLGIRPDAGVAGVLEGLYGMHREDPQAEAVRESIVDALWRYRTQEGHIRRDKVIVEALQDSSQRVRCMAAASLEANPKPSYAGPLAEAIQAVEDARSVNTFLKALMGVGNYRPGSVVPVLVRVLESRPEAQRMAMEAALQALASDTLPDDGAPKLRRALEAVYPQRIPDAAARLELVKRVVEAPAAPLKEVVLAWSLDETEAEVLEALGQALAGSAGRDPAFLVKAGEQLIEAERAAAAVPALRGALEHESLQNGSAPAADLKTRARLLLVRGLRQLGGEKRLQQAEDLLSRALEETPEEAELLRERAAVRRLLGNAEGARKDLEAGLELVLRGEGLREELHAIARELVDLHLEADPSQAAAALTILRRIPRGGWTPRLHHLAARVHAAVGQHARAHAEAVEGLETLQNGEGDLRDELRLIMVRSGLRAQLPAPRLRAAEAFPEVAEKLPEKEREELRADIRRDTAIREAVAALDAAPGGEAASKQEALVSTWGKAASPWLLEGLDTPPVQAAVLRRRLATLQALHPGDQELASMEPPAGQTSAEALSSTAATLLSWWDARLKAGSSQ